MCAKMNFYFVIIAIYLLLIFTCSLLFFANRLWLIVLVLQQGIHLFYKKKDDDSYWDTNARREIGRCFFSFFCVGWQRMRETLQILCEKRW